SSPSATWLPSTARAPLIVTRPAVISASASRREQAPLSLRYLLSRTPQRLSQGRLPAHVRLLLVTPPMTQLNTPYPATAYLTGFLRLHQARLGLEVEQADASLELFLRL